MWLQLRKGDSKLYSFADDTFKTVEFKRNQREQWVFMPMAIPKLRVTKNKINKINRDLMNLMQWVPEEYGPFENLPHGDKKSNFPQDFNHCRVMFLLNL